jgi:hypothetical protein
MAAYSSIGPTIILLSGQSLEQFLLTLVLTALAVIFSLTAFICIRLFITWSQAKLEKNRHFFRPKFKKKGGEFNGKYYSARKRFFRAAVR